MMRECLCAAVVIIASPTRQVREYLDGDTSFISNPGSESPKKMYKSMEDQNLRILASGSNYYLMYLQSSLCKIVSKLLILL